MTEVATDDAPQAFGPYSQGRIHGGPLFTAGQIGVDPATGALVAGAEAQVARVLENIHAIVSAAGGDARSILQLTVYLTDLNDWPAVNAQMQARFETPYPARSAVGVAALPFGALVEMDAVAAVQGR